MWIAISASCTCRAWASASEKTVTVSIPMARALRRMRTAISPRLATNRRRMVPLMVAYSLANLVPEDAIAGRPFAGRALGVGETDREHTARISWVDDPIIPEAGGGK